MSRYCKVIVGEAELPEVDGVKYLIYPTLETRMELLELIKKSQMVDEVDEKDESGKTVTRRIRGKHFSIGEVAKVLARMIYEGCFEHNGEGKRIKKKEGEFDTTELQILELLMRGGVLQVYMHVLKELKIIDEAKMEQMKSSAEEEVKKKELA